MKEEWKRASNPAILFAGKPFILARLVICSVRSAGFEVELLSAVESVDGDNVTGGKG